MTPLRLQTILIIAFMQYVTRYAALFPVLKKYGIELQLSGGMFACLVFSTVCIAAAGFINERKSVKEHILLSVAGTAMGAYIILKTGTSNLILTYVALALMLLLYLFVYKHYFLVGNIIVALFFAIVPMFVLLDILPIYRVYGRFIFEAGVNFDFIIYWFSGVSTFIFLTVLSCEIIKDTEDFENDNVTCDSRTFPFIMGAPYTKWTIIVINTLNIVFLCLLYGFFLRNIAAWFSIFYILLFLIIPILFINLKVHKAITGADYRFIGNIMKMILLAGVAYSVVLWW